MMHWVFLSLTIEDSILFYFKKYNYRRDSRKNDTIDEKMTMFFLDYPASKK